MLPSPCQIGLKPKRLHEGWLVNSKLLCFSLIIGNFYDSDKQSLAKNDCAQIF